MKLFFEVCKEFFDLLYLPFISDIIENEIIKEEFDEEKREEEKQDIQQEEEQDVCSFEFFIQSLSIINARIYKQLNDNKSE
jgi:hypothetical protein